MILTNSELTYLKNKIDRIITSTELQIINAEWSEHCSYKSSKNHLQALRNCNNTTTMTGHDSGVIKIDDDYVITMHIESHNHPSAIEPFGGSATGIGGVVRDILSSGTRPIALLNGLRFGDVNNANTKWIFKNVVNGVGSYGNCIGVPNVGGELEFNSCYNDYALVDVMCIGFGKQKSLIHNHANKNDLVILLGNFTGCDGVGGSQFASDSLKSNDIVSAIQIPNPFIKKLIIETILELIHHNCIKAMKDLGGGGLSCAISEIADSLSVGITIDINKIHTKQTMIPEEIITSESQERMLLIIDKNNLKKVNQICTKFDIPYSIIGTVTDNNMFKVTNNNKTLASLPIDLVVHPPLLHRNSSVPHYIHELKNEKKYNPNNNLTEILIQMITHPNLANKNWIYGQYDQEVGIRTVIKPGYDAAVLRLDNKKYLAVSMDGNPKHCYVNPYFGAIGCFDEACRNIICTGATPIGMVDHLQFGNPENPEVFWSFLQSVYGIKDYSQEFNIPCIGGKVSFYNETRHGQIKPSPVIGVIGIIDHEPFHEQQICDGDNLIMIGYTKDELGGSEYFYQIFDSYSGKCPQVKFQTSKQHINIVLTLLKNKLIKSITDCSKGGLAFAIAKLCMMNQIGCIVNLNLIPHSKLNNDKLLFSESHSRFILAVSNHNLDQTISILNSQCILFNIIGKFNSNNLIFKQNNLHVINLNIKTLHNKWMTSINKMMSNGK